MNLFYMEGISAHGKISVSTEESRKTRINIHVPSGIRSRDLECARLHVVACSDSFHNDHEVHIHVLKEPSQYLQYSYYHDESVNSRSTFTHGPQYRW